MSMNTNTSDLVMVDIGPPAYRVVSPPPEPKPFAIDREWARKVYRRQRKLIASLKALGAEADAAAGETPADLVPLLRPGGMRAGSSKYRYTMWNKDRNKFVVQLPNPGAVGYFALGAYATEDAAARAILEHTGGVVPEPRVGLPREREIVTRKRWGRPAPRGGVYRLPSGKYEGKFMHRSAWHHCGTFLTAAEATEAVQSRRAELEGMTG